MFKWWEENSTFFDKEKEIIKHQYPSLHYIVQENNIHLLGEIYIKEIDDSYSIKIAFPFDYPNSLPIVISDSEDIEKNIDLHIYSDGSCCLCLPHLEQFYFKKGSSINVFIDNLVKPFFANQAYYKITGKWLNGEYSHGLKGIYEFYSEVFECSDTYSILQLLYLSIKSAPNYNKKCYCGSNKSIKKCHLSNIVKLKKIVTLNQIKEDLQYFLKAY